jgi:hypothetical protein
VSSFHVATDHCINAAAVHHWCACRLGIVVVFAALYCQKTGKLVSSSGSSSMKSTGGRLPHVSDAPAMAPLLAKQASQPASYIQRSISNFAVPPFGGKPTVAVSVGGMVQGRSHNSQHHHTLLYDPYPAKAHPQTVSAAAAAGYANSSLIDNASGGGSAGLAAHHYMRALQNVAVHVSVGAHNAKPITPRHAARSASGMANGVAGEDDACHVPVSRQMSRGRLGGADSSAPGLGCSTRHPLLQSFSWAGHAVIEQLAADGCCSHTALAR